MKIKNKLLILIFFICQSCSAEVDYYNNLSLNAIKSAINYYTLLGVCLVNETSNKVCTQDGYVHDKKYLKELIKFKDLLVETYKKIDSKNDFQLVNVTMSLDQAETDFFNETLSLERKILIFSAQVSKKCTGDDSGVVLLEFGQSLSDYYKTSTNLDQHIGDLSEYTKSVVFEIEKLSTDKSFCSYYQEKNARIYKNVFGAQMEGIHKNWKMRTLQGYFMLRLMSEIIGNA